mmetsp:Transcript_2783/g.7771  ORF Transcript_2783/g.7771 Transcript_2783/m.7771 type:complete len:267 (+) Transcript_2783:1120-1920(+)
MIAFFDTDTVTRVLLAVTTAARSEPWPKPSGCDGSGTFVAMVPSAPKPMVSSLPHVMKPSLVADTAITMFVCMSPSMFMAMLDERSHESSWPASVPVPSVNDEASTLSPLTARHWIGLLWPYCTTLGAASPALAYVAILPPSDSAITPSAVHRQPTCCSSTVFLRSPDLKLSTDTSSSVAASRTLHEPSPEHVKICAESGDHTAPYTLPPCTFFSTISVPSLPSYTATDMSEEAEKKRAPSGEKRTTLTNRSCVFATALNLNGGPS